MHLKNIINSIINVKHKKVIISIVAGMFTILFSLLIILLFKSCNEVLPKNTYFLEYDISGMKKSELVSLIEDEVNPKYSNKEVSVIFNENYLNLKMKNYDFKIDPNEIFKLALNSNPKETTIVPPKVKFSKNKIMEELENFKKETTIEPVKYSYEKLKNNILRISAGENGKEINTNTTFEDIVNNLEVLDFSNIKASETEILDEETKIDLEKIKEEIDSKVKDASYEIDKHGKLIYEPEIIGMELDLKKAEKIIKSKDCGIYNVPITTIYPKKTVAILKHEHANAKTPEVLAQYTTNFSNNESQTNRNFNIQKAALASNNIVLYPGEEFSFRNAVSPSGKLVGYRDAKVFTANGVESGNGGGVCQVSTTIYQAAIRANMKITERHSHSQQVHYVPIGQDAAFDASGTDLRFKNSRKDPIRIILSFTDKSLTCAIKGTKRSDENYEVEINSETTSKDPNRINAVAHKKVKKNGQIVKEEHIPSSYKIFKK